MSLKSNDPVKISQITTSEKEDGYWAFEAMIRINVAMGRDAPIFTTNANPDKLWELYLGGMSGGKWPHYKCNTCKRFVQTYGGLVTIQEHQSFVKPMSGDEFLGKACLTHPLIWRGSPTDWPKFFRYSVHLMNEEVIKSGITGVFYSSEKTWGVPVTGQWTHMSAENPRVVADTPVKTCFQMMAEKKEEYGMLCRALAGYPQAAVNQAVRILEGEILCRSEKAMGVAKWFKRLHESLVGMRGRQRDNLIWLAVAGAPPGFCHVGSTVISTLLDDIIAGYPVAVIQDRWAKKLHPMTYQRPTAPPKSGTIDQAEKLVEKMKLAPSLERRYATLDDVQTKLWVPTPPMAELVEGGVFSHLRQSSKPSVGKLDLPPLAITWEKFQRTVLPTAQAMEVYIPNARCGFYGLTAAVHPDAPPILQWDGLEGHPRNTASIYVYRNGSMPSNWGLTAGSWVKVTAVFEGPHKWQEPSKFLHHGDEVNFALEGAWDCNPNNIGLSLFPETLRAELHEVRSVIEAYSNKGKINNPELGNANGISFPKLAGKKPAISAQNALSVTIRVINSDGTAVYILDRWD